MARYSATTHKAINQMEVDWVVYNINGPEQDWGHLPLQNTNYLYDESIVGVLAKSYAEWILQHNTQTWKPKGYAYHCIFDNTRSLDNTAAALTEEEISPKNTINSLKNKSVLPVQYTNFTSYNDNEQLSIVKETFEEFYGKDLSAYHLENGHILTVDHLKIKERKNASGKKFEDDQLQISISKKDNTDFTYIKVSVPYKVFDENNIEHKIDGYILISNSNQDKLDFGLIETEFQ